MAFGATAFGAGDPLIFVESARLAALNAIALQLFPGSDPGLENPYRLGSLFYWGSWAVQSVDGHRRLARWVAINRDSWVLTVTLDGNLRAGVTYEVLCAVAEIASHVYGLRVGATAVGLQEREQVVQDWAKPERARDTQGGSIGTVQIIGGDLALTSGAASLYERIVRKVQTIAGQMAHDRDYGMTWRQGGLLTVDALQRYQARLQAQIRNEPDVARVTVSVGNVPESPGLVSVLVSADTVDGPVTVSTNSRRS